MKLKNDESKFLSIMTVEWEEKVLKCDKHEIRLSQQGPCKIKNCKFICHKNSKAIVSTNTGFDA